MTWVINGLTLPKEQEAAYEWWKENRDEPSYNPDMDDVESLRRAIWYAWGNQSTSMAVVICGLFNFYVEDGMSPKEAFIKANKDGLR